MIKKTLLKKSNFERIIDMTEVKNELLVPINETTLASISGFIGKRCKTY